MSWLGHVPEGFITKLSEMLITNYEFIVAVSSAYAARPSMGDEPVVVAK